MNPTAPSAAGPSRAPAGPVLLTAASHLAVWSGLYIAAGVYCFADLARLWPSTTPGRRAHLLAFAFCTAAAVYLLDRVKLADRWLDPADDAAHPHRFRFLARRSRAVRILSGLLLLVAAVLGFFISPLAPALVLAAATGVIAYAGRPRRARPRIKDVFLLKNFYVAAGITGFAALITILSQSADPLGSIRSHAAAIAASAAHLIVRVWADAALCDLDDEAADRAFGTATLATGLGRARAWNTAMSVRLLLALALITIIPGPRRSCIAWAIVTAVSSVALRLAQPSRVREWVDARFAAEALAVWAVVHIIP
ncbi:MAG: hypothetical protein IT436_10965 [Phycisphaerales bacterium]|nr:hypothetical protein [Phycisphaerales bacterium]